MANGIQKGVLWPMEFKNFLDLYGSYILNLKE